MPSASEKRILVLETAVADLVQTVDDLNHELYRQQQDFLHLKQDFERLKQDVHKDNSQDFTLMNQNEKPPHY